MNKLGNYLQQDVEGGWSIHIYNSERRLLCSLYPSHGWLFLAGIVLGFLIASIGFANPIATYSPPSTLAPKNAPLNLD